MTASRRRRRCCQPATLLCVLLLLTAFFVAAPRVGQAQSAVVPPPLPREATAQNEGRRANPAARRRALAYLRNTPAPPDKGDPRAQAERILAGREFRDAAESGKPKAPTWWDRFLQAAAKEAGKVLEAIGRFLAWLFRGFRPPRAGPMATGLGQMALYILYFLAGVAALVGLYFLARLLQSRYGADVTSGRSGRRAAGTGVLDLDDSAINDPLAAARLLANQGDYRGAVRLVYIAALRRLASGGLLVLERNKTNWEYQRALRSSRAPEVYETLLPATRLFDHVWYGERPATRAEYESAVAAHDRLPEPTGAPSVAETKKP